MKVLLISTNRLGYPKFVLPLGIATVASYLEKEGFDVLMQDLCFLEENQIFPEIEKTIADFKPDAIGLGIRNYCTFMDDPPLFFLPFIKDVVDCCKKHSEVPVILGGGGFSNNSKEILSYTGAQYGIKGDGELSLKDFLLNIDNPERYSTIPGLVYHNENDIVENALDFPDDINSFPIINRDFYDKRYYNVRSELGLKTTEALYLTRGCPYKCIYCSSKNFYSTKFRARNIDSVIDELKMLIDNGAEEVEFIDFAFNLPVGNSQKFLERMIEEGIKVKWTCNIHPYPLNSLSRELFSLMKEAGCTHVDFDTITCSEKIARNMKRPGFSKEAIIKAAQWCHEFDLPFSHYLLIGGPGEDAETLKETLETIEMTNPTANPKVVSNVGLVIGAHTELAEIALKENAINEGDDLLFPPKFYLSDDMDAKAIELIDEYRNKHLDWLFVGITLEKLLKNSKINESFVEGLYLPDEKIEEGKPFPGVVLHDLDRKLVNLSEPAGKVKLLIIDSRQSGQKAGPWMGNFKKNLVNHNDIVPYFISTIEKLRFFVSKDFILGHIREASRGINRILDWEHGLVRTMGIEDISKPILCIIDREGILKEIIHLNDFTMPEFQKVFNKIIKL